jgi:hypothetical protein
VRRLRTSRQPSPPASASRPASGEPGSGGTSLSVRIGAGGAIAKQVEAYAVEEDGDWLVITVLVKYF